MYHIVGSNESLVQTDFLERRFIMTRPEQHHSKSIRLQALGALVTMFVVSVFAVNSAEGQAYTVIHNFAGYDGNQPMVGLTMDRRKSVWHDLSGRDRVRVWLRYGLQAGAQRFRLDTKTAL